MIGTPFINSTAKGLLLIDDYDRIHGADKLAIQSTCDLQYYMPLTDLGYRFFVKFHDMKIETPSMALISFLSCLKCLNFGSWNESESVATMNIEIWSVLRIESHRIAAYCRVYAQFIIASSSQIKSI